jgi:hypothetical protein
MQFHSYGLDIKRTELKAAAQVPKSMKKTLLVFILLRIRRPLNFLGPALQLQSWLLYDLF